MLATKLMIARTRNTNRKVRPISIEIPANPIAPKRKATSASTKKVIAAFSINTPIVVAYLGARFGPHYI
jgi:hypothetical protein